MTTRTAPSPSPPAPPAPGRLRATWTAAHAPVAGVGRWARIAAVAVPLTVLPSSAWRIATCVFGAPLFGADPTGSGNLPGWLPLGAYVILLSLASELLAFAAVGLVARWGEVFPWWIPLLRGRRIPVPFAVIPATLGAVALIALWTDIAVMGALGRTLTGHPLSAAMPLATHNWQTVVLVVCYAPLLVWGPLLALLTVAYAQRRRSNQ